MKPDLTIKESQAYIQKMMKERGWDKRSILLQTVMMAEEMGEVAKAIRYLELNGSTSENKQELAYELADVFNYTCWLATTYDIDLAQAFQEKFEINKGRRWE